MSSTAPTLEIVYIIVATLTQCILFILLIIGIQQLCITDNFDEKPRLRRILLIILNLLSFLCLNPLVYLSALHPHKRVFGSDLSINALFILFEAIAAIIGFHTFGKMFIFIIDTIYKDTSMRSPKWFNYFVNAVEVIAILSIIVCHSFAVIANSSEWIFLFYVIFGALVFILDIAIIGLLHSALRLYAGISANFEQIKEAKFLIKMAICIGFGIIICCIIDITFTVLLFFHLFVSDFFIISNIMHSVILIAVGLAEIVWIYKKELCCVVPEDSMCDVWCNQLCCGELPEYEDSDSDGLNAPILNTVDSVNSLNLTHTLNTKDLMPNIMEPSLQSNQLSVVEDLRSVKSVNCKNSF